MYNHQWLWVQSHIISISHITCHSRKDSPEGTDTKNYVPVTYNKQKAI